MGMPDDFTIHVGLGLIPHNRKNSVLESSTRAISVGNPRCLVSMHISNLKYSDSKFDNAVWQRVVLYNNY